MAAQSIAHSSLAVCPLILGLAAAALEHRRFSERDAARTLVLALFLGSLVAVLFELDHTRAFAPSRRWDAPIYCAAREAYDAGLSPYLVANLKRFRPVDFSFVYPLHALLLLKPFCSGDMTFRFTVLSGPASPWPSCCPPPDCACGRIGGCSPSFSWEDSLEPPGTSLPAISVLSSSSASPSATTS